MTMGDPALHKFHHIRWYIGIYVLYENLKLVVLISFTKLKLSVTASHHDPKLTFEATTKC